MLIGYTRVSTHDETVDPQVDALREAGCEQLFTDTVSGGATERPGLASAVSHLGEGDALVVWRLDRLGRSVPHLIETLTDLKNRGIGFKSLTEGIDTTKRCGKLVFRHFGALAEFERDISRERTEVGIAAAKARGRSVGRRNILTPKEIASIKKLYADKKTPIDDICKIYNISRMTLWRYVKAEQRRRRSSSPEI
jgi:DNA invertase Pin-like site-specific DNA recombinase